MSIFISDSKEIRAVAHVRWGRLYWTKPKTYRMMASLLVWGIFSILAVQWHTIAGVIVFCPGITFYLLWYRRMMRQVDQIAQRLENEY